MLAVVRICLDIATTVERVCSPPDGVIQRWPRSGHAVLCVSTMPQEFALEAKPQSSTVRSTKDSQRVRKPVTASTTKHRLQAATGDCIQTLWIRAWSVAATRQGELKYTQPQHEDLCLGWYRSSSQFTTVVVTEQQRAFFVAHLEVAMLHYLGSQRSRTTATSSFRGHESVLVLVQYNCSRVLRMCIVADGR